MQQTNAIRKNWAFLLLLVFAISITPKVWFHDILSQHVDAAVCRDTDKSVPHFHQPAFHCSFDELVVSSPFLLAELKKLPEPPVVYLHHTPLFKAFVFSSPLLHTESRGPPLT